MTPVYVIVPLRAPEGRMAIPPESVIANPPKGGWQSFPNLSLRARRKAGVAISKSNDEIASLRSQ
jgi:hypothetical protein